MSRGVVYLDVETDRAGAIYLVGVLSRAKGLVQLLDERVTRTRLRRALPAAGTLVTFNGTSFDLPRINDQLGLDLEMHFASFDLMHACAARGLRHGQKEIEKRLKYVRAEEPLSHWQQWRLHSRWLDERCVVSRDRILRYNAHDLMGMRWIRNRLSKRT